MTKAINKPYHSIRHRLRTCITTGGTKGSLVAVGDAVYTDTIIVLNHSLDIFLCPTIPKWNSANVRSFENR